MPAFSSSISLSTFSEMVSASLFRLVLSEERWLKKYDKLQDRILAVHWVRQV